MSYYPKQSCYDPCRPRSFSSGSSLLGSKRRTRWSSGSCLGSYGRGVRYYPSCGYGYGGYQSPACYQPLSYNCGYGYGYGKKYCPPVWYGGYGSGGYDYGCRYGGLLGRRQSICYDPCYGPKYQYGSRRGSYCWPC
ncbi:keratin-associated protein 21-1-like [Thamnophis elegans]|uniref:keratin-associated protein 21-1-like n=1 Tax=Thamnophis elegans TaxID=35005 RepID=UPI0013780ADA|nr:keratin-associated protein 21-1-like [Thamnophis elegans]